MKLDAFILADTAGAYDNKLFVQGGGVSRLEAVQLPLMVAHLAVVARFLLDEDDPVYTTPTALYLAFVAPNGELVVQAADVTVPPQPKDPAKMPGEEATMMVIIEAVNLVFKTEGMHHVTFKVNGDVVRDVSLPLRLRKAAQAPRAKKPAGAPKNAQPRRRR